MIRRSMRAGALALLTVVSACDSDPVVPDGDMEGIHFRDGAGVAWDAAGTPSTDGGLLDTPFAVARADSVGGIVLIGFDPRGDESGDLFVLQAPRSAGAYVCAEFGEPCHGRFITGVTIESTATFDRFYSVVAGSVSLTMIGPDRLRGSFDLKLVDGSTADTIAVNGGVVDVPYVGEDVTDGALGCLLSLVGIGTGSCSG